MKHAAFVLALLLAGASACTEKTPAPTPDSDRDRQTPGLPPAALLPRDDLASALTQTSVPHPTPPTTPHAMSCPDLSYEEPRQQATCKPSAKSSNDYACLSRREVSERIDAMISDLMTPWKASLFFRVYVVESNKVDVSTLLSGGSPSEVNIADYLGGQKHGAKRPATKLYFSPVTFPPPKDGTKLADHEPWGELKRQLERVAAEAGNPIFSKGATGNVDVNRRFRCKRNRPDRSSKDPGDDANIRGTTLVNNDKSNRRPNGRSMPRKTNSHETSCSCPFAFTVSWDKHGFFVQLAYNSGYPQHEGHRRPLDTASVSLPTRLLSSEEKEGRRSVVEATCDGGSGRNYLFKKTGKFFDHVKLAYLDKDSVGDDVENMLKTFKDSEEIEFTTMSDVPVEDLEGHVFEPADDTVTVSTTKKADGVAISTPVSDIASLEGVEEQAKDARTQKNMKASDYLFMSIAWILLPAFRFFLLCPEVIWCDTTSHSNNKGFHLLTFSCRTSLDRQVIFMYLWIPNEKRMSFRWVFQHAVPILIPKWARDRVKFIMKDGDPQQRNEILHSLKEVFGNAAEGSCGWHIVSQGWKKHLPGTTTFTDPIKWERTKKIIMNWVYSWMRPGYVEDDDELNVSKYKLVQFVTSSAVLDAAEGKKDVVARVLHFLQNHVFVHEDLYLWYKRKKIRHFNVSHSSPHEVSFPEA